MFTSNQSAHHTYNYSSIPITPRQSMAIQKKPELTSKPFDLRKLREMEYEAAKTI